MSSNWFEKQKMKIRPKKVDDILYNVVKNTTNNEEINKEINEEKVLKKIDDIKSNEKETEKKEMNKMNKLIVAVDAGKGYTKYFYRIPVKEIKKKDGSIGYKYREEEKIFTSSVVVGSKALNGDTIYIDGVEHDFHGTKKAVELRDKHKDNNEHKALMQKALFDIAKQEGITRFDVIMCTSLDHYKLESNVEQMKETMSVGEFNIRDDFNSFDITVENVVIEPETLVSTRFASTTLPNVLAVLVDIGTLNVGIVPLNRAKLNKATITAPLLGYNYMINEFKEYLASTKDGALYSKEVLEMYVDMMQGKRENLDGHFRDFFINVYAKTLKNKIDEKGFEDMANLIFVGGTSIACKELILEAFGNEYENVEVVEDIFATVKGAYGKGLKDLKRLENINK